MPWHEICSRGSEVLFWQWKINLDSQCQRFKKCLFNCGSHPVCTLKSGGDSIKTTEAWAPNLWGWGPGTHCLLQGPACGWVCILGLEPLSRRRARCHLPCHSRVATGSSTSKLTLSVRVLGFEILNSFDRWVSGVREGSQQSGLLIN